VRKLSWEDAKGAAATREPIASMRSHLRRWLPQTPIEVFEVKVLEWLALKDESPRLIASLLTAGASGEQKRLKRVGLVKAGSGCVEWGP